MLWRGPLSFSGGLAFALSIRLVDNRIEIAYHMTKRQRIHLLFLLGLYLVDVLPLHVEQGAN